MPFNTGGGGGSSGGAVNLGSAYGEINVSMDGAQRQLNNQVGQLERGITRSFGRIGSNVQALGMSLTRVLAPVTGFVVGGIASFAQFDDILTEIAARTGATADEMEQVRLTALRMGQETAFSATEASDGMLQLLSSGFDLEQTFAALPHVLNLAAAGMLDVGFAGDAVTDILAQFNMTAEGSEQVADALAQAAGSSSATITDLIAGFANVGPVAANFGMSVEDTAAALAVFSENGIKGAQAGTQLRSMLMMMTSTTPAVTAMWDSLGVSMFEADGTMRNMDDVIDDLNVAMEGMSDEERIETIRTLGGAYGQMGLSALLAADGIDSMSLSMQNAATAAELGQARMASFKGVVNQLKSSLQTIALNVIGPLVENYLQPLAEAVVVVLNEFNEWLMLNPVLAEALGLVLGVLAILGPAVWALGFAISALLSPIGIFVGLFGVAFQNNLFGIRSALEPIISGFQMFFRILEMGGTTTDAFRLGLRRAIGQDTIDRIVEIGNAIQEFLIDTFDAAGRMFDNVWNTIGPILSQLWNAIDEMLAPLGGMRSAVEFLGNGLISFLFPPLGLVLRLFTLLRLAMGALSGGARNLGKNLKKIFRDLARNVSNLLPQIADVLSEMGIAFIDWISEVGPQVVDGVINMVSSIAIWLAVAIPQIASALLSWSAAFLNWLGPVIRDILPRLGEFIGSIIEWLLGTGLPMLLQATVQLGAALIVWIIDAIPKIAPAFLEFLMALGSFIISDLIPGVIGFARGIGSGLLSGIEEGIGSFATFLWNDVFIPGLQALAEWFTSGQAASDLLAIAMGILNGLATAFRELAPGATWLWENVFQPMLVGLAEWFTSGQAAEDLLAIVNGFFAGLIGAFALLVEGTVWLWTNLFQPMLTALIEWFTSGQAAEDLLKLAAAFFVGLLAAFVGIAAGAVWLWTNVFQPMLVSIATWFTSGQAARDLLAISAAILGGLAEAFGDVAQWVLDTIVNPIVDAIKPLADLIRPAMDALVDAMTLAFNAVTFAGQQMAVDMVRGITAGVNLVIGTINGLIVQYNRLVALMGGEEIPLLAQIVLPDLTSTAPTPTGGFFGPDRHADGLLWTGAGGRNRSAGIHELHAGETVLPQDGFDSPDGFRVRPSKQGPRIDGLREMMSNINNIFNRLDANLANSMMGMGASQAQVADGGASGGDTSINFNGNIVLEVSDETLRDPEMVANAQQFGRSLADGMLTNDGIMERVRGQS